MLRYQAICEKAVVSAALARSMMNHMGVGLLRLASPGISSVQMVAIYGLTAAWIAPSAGQCIAKDRIAQQTNLLGVWLDHLALMPIQLPSIATAATSLR